MLSYLVLLKQNVEVQLHRFEILHIQLALQLWYVLDVIILLNQGKVLATLDDLWVFLDYLVNFLQLLVIYPFLLNLVVHDARDYVFRRLHRLFINFV